MQSREHTRRQHYRKRYIRWIPCVIGVFQFHFLFFGWWGVGVEGVSVLEFDAGAPAYDDMKIHTAKHIRGALICEPNLFIIVCQTPPYQNPTGNIIKMKIL